MTLHMILTAVMTMNKIVMYINWLMELYNDIRMIVMILMVLMYAMIICSICVSMPACLVFL